MTFIFIVKTFQTIVLFIIPLFTGIAILRGIFSVRNSLFLFSGGMIFGLAILMALINELRFFLNMSLSLWYSIKLEFLIGLLIVLFRKSHFKKISIFTNLKMWLWSSAAILIAAITSLYFTYPASKGVLNDAWWGHYLFNWLIRFQTTFPLERVFSPWDPVYYHYGPDILASLWTHFFLLDQHDGFVFNIAIFVFLGFLVVFYYAYTITKNEFFSILCAGLAFASGNSKFLTLIGEDKITPSSILSAVNSYTIEGPLEMVFTPSHAVGIPFMFLGLFLLEKTIRRPQMTRIVFWGIFFGISSLVAEWYFGLLFLSAFISIFVALWKRRRKKKKFNRVLVALAIGVFISVSNHSYVAGFMQRFKIQEESASLRISKNFFKYHLDGLLPIPAIYTDTVPDLVPFRLNFDHFGYFPSWEKGGSNHSAYTPIFSSKIFLECFPVVFIGLFFPYFLLKRPKFFQNSLSIWIVIWVSFLVPAILDWGYRSADLLRFMVPVVSFSGFVSGIFFYTLWRQKKIYQILSIVLLVFSLSSAGLLGIIGLSPNTFATVKKVSSTASTLKDTLTETEDQKYLDSVKKNTAFEILSKKIGGFLFPLVRQKENVAILVSKSLVPPQEHFPEWMKFSSYTGLIVPTGVHWDKGLHSVVYKKIMDDLSMESLFVLEIQWVIDTNLFEDPEIVKVRSKLNNRSNFQPVLQITEDRYWMKLYKVKHEVKF